MVTNKIINDNKFYILTEIIPKMKYNHILNAFVIKFEDYVFLSPFQREQLEQICKENNIYLEQLPTPNNSYENQTLIREYKKIKKTLSKNKKDKDLQNILIEIRNRIVTGSMEYVIKLINIYVPDINELQDIEDIYQIGYETLFRLIDLYDESKNSTFAHFCQSYLVRFTMRQAMKESKGLKQCQIEECSKLNTARTYLQDKLKRIPSLEELSKETGYSENRIKRILILENIANPISLEETKKEDLIDYDFEDRVIDSVLERTSYLIKLIDTLNPIQREVLRLYYGFEDDKTYTYDEIKDKLGINISRERVRQIKEEALEELTNSIRGSYLADAYGKTQEHNKTKRISLGDKVLIDLLIEKEIPRNILLEIVNNFETPNKEIISMYYGLSDGIKYDLEEISKIVKLPKTKVSLIKNEYANKIVKKVVRLYNPNFKGNYISYLLNRYLNREEKHKNR